MAMIPVPSQEPTKKARGVSSIGKPSGSSNNYFCPLKSLYRTRIETPAIASEARTSRPVKNTSNENVIF
jgi:hypothetical protein